MLLHNQSLPTHSLNFIMSRRPWGWTCSTALLAQTARLKCWLGQRLQCRCAICQPLSFSADRGHELLLLLLLPVLYTPALNHTAELWITDLRRIPVLSSAKEIFRLWKSQTHSGGFYTQKKKCSSRGCLVRKVVVPLLYMCDVNDSKWGLTVWIRVAS